MYIIASSQMRKQQNSTRQTKQRQTEQQIYADDRSNTPNIQNHTQISTVAAPNESWVNF